MEELDKLPDVEIHSSASERCGGTHQSIGGIGGGICWDPCWKGPYTTADLKKAKASPERVLGHELGHAAGYEDPLNVMVNENPLAFEWGEPLRYVNPWKLFGL